MRKRCEKRGHKIVTAIDGRPTLPWCRRLGCNWPSLDDAMAMFGGVPVENGDQT